MKLNNYLDLKMEIFTGTILLIAATFISGQMSELDMMLLNRGQNKHLVPDDLHLLYNKTDEDVAYEECMAKYSLCMTFQRKRTDYDYRICAVNKNTTQKESFKTLCEMIYENCKNDDGAWGYFHDGECKVEFVTA